MRFERSSDDHACKAKAIQRAADLPTDEVTAGIVLSVVERPSKDPAPS